MTDQVEPIKRDKSGLPDIAKAAADQVMAALGAKDNPFKTTPAEQLAKKPPIGRGR